MRILVLSCSVGAGHIRAAEAIELALARCGSPQSGEPLAVENVDVLTLTPKNFQKVYRDAYFAMVAKSPAVLGWLYDKTNRPFRREPLREKLERVNASGVLERIRAFDSDIAICTHFLPAALLARERRKDRSHAKIITVVTDFEVHGLWLKVPSDHYFVATEEARVHLEALGVASSTITVSGIPTHPVFSEKKDRLAMRRKHGLRDDLPVILLSAGGFGAGNAVRMVQSLIEAKTPAQIIAVCGKNPALQTSLEVLAHARPANALPLIKVVGFTSEMDEYMSAADLMLGKPGGLTTSESLIKGLGWVVVNPIPGQEEKNAIYLLEQGVGIWSDNLHTLAYKVTSLLDEPGRLASMRKNALRLARPGAARTISEFVINQRT